MVAERPWKLAGDNVPGKRQTLESVPEGTAEALENKVIPSVLPGRETLMDIFPGTLCRADFRCRSATFIGLPIKNTEEPKKSWGERPASRVPFPVAAQNPVTKKQNGTSRVRRRPLRCSQQN